ncbi:TusE/DsrC/DsvC family sulfur relay protein [Sulfuricystis multivorans]|uniref:TusE/DsrC/DsvC family sulfur relay protein n=1 Tax=Sulfuricystis multivorans TaxID=2211108 RepID=UPI000F849D93|nr:TusE/DsrC/DsvC family sulfur relay protein [Sulfuricystis multivorans]
MYDINKFIANPSLVNHDVEGFLADLPHWSPRFAHQRAEEEGLTLTDAHWDVIVRLRELYRAEGPGWNARDVTRALEKDFAAAGGRRHLYALFPGGPLAQGCKLAGLPLPEGTLDPSFGSVH